LTRGRTAVGGYSVQEFFSNLISRIGVLEVIDIAIIAFILYKTLGFIRESRAEQLFKGLVVLILITVVSGLVQLYALSWILKQVMNVGIIALVVVFQPELRRAFERIGRNNLLQTQFQNMNKEDAKKSVTDIVKTVAEFSAEKVGAIIILERRVSLNDFAESGVILNSDISMQLLGNVFYVGSPLHDGAVIIKGNKIYAAGVVLPLTRNSSLPKELGTRHRAALGISEVSDAFAIIVSEETGVISTADDGKLKRFLDTRALEKEILNIYLGEFSAGQSKSLTGLLKRIFTNGNSVKEDLKEEQKEEPEDMEGSDA